MLKLHAGVSKKVGLPGFSSASASCTIEAELDGSLLHDREGFQIVVKRAYQSCEQAVEDQIARLLVQGNPTTNSPACVPVVSEHPQTTNGPQTRIRAIAARRKIDLVGMLRERFGLTTADELGIRQASNLIDELKSDGETSPGTSGNGAYATTGGAR